jgi:hypothetical protein
MNIAILGQPNSAKSSLMITLMRQSTKPKKYLFGYPKQMDGFESINDIEDLAKITNCCVGIDEFGRHFKPYDKQGNNALLEFLMFAAHNNVDVYLNTQNSQFITRSCEAFIHAWAIKQMNSRTLKQGSMPSWVLNHGIKDRRIGHTFINLQINEYVWYNIAGVIGENGVKTFENPNVGKDWSVCPNNTDNCDKSPNMPEQTPNKPDSISVMALSEYLIELQNKYKKGIKPAVCIGGVV